MTATTEKSTAEVQNASKQERTVAAIMDQAAEKLPAYAKYINMAKPFVVGAADAVDKAYPYMVKFIEWCQQVWIKMQPYDPQQFFPLVFGLVLCFFGGSYLTLIAAVEAVRMTVWEQLKKSAITLYENYQRAHEASLKDDALDEDGNGIPDVEEISKKELVSRKFYIVLKAINPDEASHALNLCWGAIISVIATLRIQFAQAVTLGSSIGQMLHRHLDSTVQPAIDKALPQELKKWAPVSTVYFFNMIGVTFAWFLQRIISGFHSALRGGTLFVHNAIRLAKKHGYLEEGFEENSPKVSIMASAVGLIGFYWQLSNGFALPFPLNILLLPLTFVEWWIGFWVGV